MFRYGWRKAARFLVSDSKMRFLKMRFLKYDSKIEIFEKR